MDSKKELQGYKTEVCISFKRYNKNISDYLKFQKDLKIPFSKLYFSCFKTKPLYLQWILTYRLLEKIIKTDLKVCLVSTINSQGLNCFLKEFAKKYNMFHMLGKWRAGSLTTFGKDLKDINFFNKKSFIYLPKKPDFILLLNTYNADIIIKEARLCKIPILGILNASANTDISYFIMKDDVGINTTLLNILWLESLIIKIKNEDSFKL